PDGAFGAVTKSPCARARGQEVVDAGGRLLMPALINCHTHLYSTLARGMAIPGRAPRDFLEILDKLWWRLDCALNEEDIYYTALVGLIDSAKCGVGTLVDHHSSPNACAGSLDRVEQAFREVGLRGALCYETSDRHGARKAVEGIRENVRFLERVAKSGDGMIGGAFGLHAAFTLGDRTLRQAVEANQPLGGAFHIHVAEDPCDAGAVGRLRDLGVLDERTLAAHCLHIDAGEIGILARRHVNVIHNPQSNCNNAVGMANVAEMMRRGVAVGLGSDGYSPRMWDEFKTAFHVQKLRSGDPRVGYAEAYAAAFRHNRDIVRKLWGMDVGRLARGARADLIMVDYFPPAPLRADNLFGHLLFGIANAPVDSLIVNGRFIVRDKRCVTVDERAVAEKAARQARSLWRRFEASCKH
ncbi:MAG TPA: putative aminohydrolase SsnA, partial [Candidatus Sulfopaludibacter sp.]|nr:putative aminohydrolase SsnA [Candidatus Sulfopaludibacter sp.]